MAHRNGQIRLLDGASQKQRFYALAVDVVRSVRDDLQSKNTRLRRNAYIWMFSDFHKPDRDYWLLHSQIGYEQVLRSANVRRVDKLKRKYKYALLPGLPSPDPKK